MKKKAVKKKYDWIAIAFLLPMVGLLTAFVVIPLIYAFVVSFYEWNFYRDSVYIGWENYRRVWVDKNFWNSLWVGLKFALMVVPTQFVLAFFLAHMIRNMRQRLGGFVKVSIYIPTVVSGVAAALIFSFIYNYNGGIANAIVTALGFEPIAWLQDVDIVLGALAAPAIWLGLGFTTLIMLAGLNDIPISYYEAADMDGANAIQKVFRITVPLMKNIFLYVLLTGIIGAIQQFDLPYTMTGGGPLNMTTTPNLFIYNHFTNDPYLGYTISASLMLFVILGLISAVVFRVFRFTGED
ncbi:carbohydrate ABC transporter permease [Fundicoccus culcitae]|uniref:Sugar ABC transporter permease n=1 Tax=Fundicoccus culcitae TaxID=2969821 RepID=A0ABY5P5V9_9LACT|nr:sugar ABC transporter permease [Fundicoccus culcitae]UUX33765.1 sugar ABC transporter permease [Fundicoccus culcitae]